MTPFLRIEYKPIEIVVVDNASHDASLEILQYYGDKITVIRNSSNVGYAKGCNIGIKESKSDYIVTLNNDMVVDEHWLSDAIPFLESNPHVGIISCRQMNYYQRNKIESLFHYLTPGLDFGEYRFGENYYELPISYVISANGGSAIYRTKLLKELNGFKEMYFGYYEDSDLCFRALLHGWKCIYMPSAIVYHRRTHSFSKNKKAWYFLGERNRFVFLLSNFPITYLLLHLHVLIAKDLKILFIYIVRKKPLYIYLKSRFHALRYFFSLKWFVRDNRYLFKKNKEYIQRLGKLKYIPYS